MFVQKTENGKKLFFRNSILTMMSKEEHQAMKTCFNKVHEIPCKPTVEPKKKRTSAMFFSHEYRLFNDNYPT